MTDTPDPLDALLAPPAAAADDGLKRAVFARTTRVLRRRRLARRLLFGVALAACYLGGVFSARWLASPPRERERIVYVDRPAPREQPVPQAESAAALERRARDDDRPRPELYRRAGDLFAEQEGDLQAALRCYGEALDAAPDGRLPVAAGDHWLLLAIKDARETEKRHAKIPQ